MVIPAHYFSSCKYQLRRNAFELEPVNRYDDDDDEADEDRNDEGNVADGPDSNLIWSWYLCGKPFYE